MRETVSRISDRGLVLSVRVTPKANADEVIGLHAAPDGRMSLAVKVRALPDKGRANLAVIETLARALRIPKSRITLVSGATGRNKTVLIAGDANELKAAIEKLVGRLKRETG